jgi:hypothetical protein
MPAAATGEYLLLWAWWRAGMATRAIQDNGGAWVLRYYDGDIHDGPCNFDLPEKTDPAPLALWVSGQLGYPVTLAQTGRPRWWVPYRLRGCGETTVFSVAATR